MEKEILAGALFILAFVSPTPPATNNTQISQDRVYEVTLGDSLTSIAKKEYGSADYWTTIWNDNDWIKDSNIIEKNTKLKLRNETPLKPEPLKKELADRTGSYLAYDYQTESTQPTYQYIPPTSPSSLTQDQINFLGSCESGMTASRNSGNGFYGAFQFTPGTWNNMGTGYERADFAPLEVQVDAVQRLLQRSSIYTQFPGCSAKMRTSGIL